MFKPDDEKVQQALKPHLRFLEEAGTDMQLLSPRPYTLMHHEKPDKIVHWYVESCNSLIASQCRMHPKKFKGVAALPQSVGTDIKHSLPELERCVNELGFVGCLVNPDPGARGDDSTPAMGDEYWYPLYEKLVELDVPCMIHSSTCLSSRLSYTLHFINEESIAIVSLLNSRVFEDFPKLKIVVAHGGGYVSHYPARMDHVWNAREDARTLLKKSPRRSLAKLYFDTIVFDRAQLQHLVNLWGSDHVVVGTDYPYDMGWYDPRGFVDGCAFLEDGDRAKILGLNAAKLLKLKRPAVKTSAKR